MRDQRKHLPVNWIDGMKINKAHFIAQDNAWQDALHDAANLSVSPLRYGILPPSVAGEDSFDLTISSDNQQMLRVHIRSCQAITAGGARIMLPALPGDSTGTGLPPASYPLSTASGEQVHWVVIVVNPFERQPAGSPDLAETPPRLPGVVPAYTVQVVSDSQYRQYASHPYALTIGKVVMNGSDIRVDENYIPPCYSVSAHPDLVTLHGELDGFLGSLEQRCSQIVQKIYRKSQQNDLSDLVLFLCDRVMLFLGTSITAMRWMVPHESPAALFEPIVSLARVMKNTIDLRTGTGKDEMMNYFSEWSELKQGEFLAMLSGLSAFSFDNNDLDRNIQKIVQFVRITGKLFETLSNLEFIGKRKDTGIFVKEEIADPHQPDAQKQRRRFFG